MRIFYVTNARLPTEKAHGLATVKLCEAFAKQGAEVTIFCPWRINPLRQDIFDYYRAERIFRVQRLPSIDLLWLGFGERFLFLLQLFSFSKVAALWLLVRYALWGKLSDVVIFSHDHVPLFFASFIGPKIFYDIHHYPEHTPLYERVLRKSIDIGVQTKWKIEKLSEDFGIPPEKIVYWPNGTDVERFDIPLSASEAREQLKLPQDKKLVVYTGSLQKWKGVCTLVQAAPMSQEGMLVYIVGGDEQELINDKCQMTNYKRNVVFVPPRPWSEMPFWLKAADVLVLPNTGEMKVSRHYTSPMKLFEYMASGRSIVASDISSIREIVDERMAFFATPDDPQSFADAMQHVLANPGEAQRRAERARQEVVKYTWNARAEKILAQIRKS